MHLPIAISLLVFAPLVSRPISDNFERCYQNLGHDCYYVLNERYLGLQEFEFFWVDEVDRANYSIRGAAYINKSFHRFEGTFKDKRISFEISLSEGLAYRFVGTFLPGGRTDKEGRIAIDGRLAKMSASKKIGARNVKLFVGHGSNQ
jgi:hypothetical protein